MYLVTRICRPPEVTSLTPDRVPDDVRPPVAVMRPDEVIVPPAVVAIELGDVRPPDAVIRALAVIVPPTPVVVIELGVVSPPVAVIRLAADNVPVEVRVPAVSDNTLRLPAEALIVSHLPSAADQTTKIVSPSVMVSVLKGTPLFPIIEPLPALVTMTGLEIFVALM